jgi:hypothetical protein
MKNQVKNQNAREEKEKNSLCLFSAPPADSNAATQNAREELFKNRKYYTAGLKDANKVVRCSRHKQQ